MTPPETAPDFTWGEALLNLPIVLPAIVVVFIVACATGLAIIGVLSAQAVLGILGSGLGFASSNAVMSAVNHYNHLLARQVPWAAGERRGSSVTLSRAGWGKSGGKNTPEPERPSANANPWKCCSPNPSEPPYEKW